MLSMYCGPITYRLNAFYRLNVIHKWPDQECHHVSLISCASAPYGKRLLSLTWHPVWLLKEARSPQVPRWQKENSHIWISIIKAAWARARGRSQALSPSSHLVAELWQKQECKTSLQSAQSACQSFPWVTGFSKVLNTEKLLLFSFTLLF